MPFAGSRHMGEYLRSDGAVGEQGDAGDAAERPEAEA